MPVFHEEWEQYVGIRMYRDSLLFSMGMESVTEPLTDEEKILLGNINQEFHDSVSEILPLAIEGDKLFRAADFPRVKDGEFYKFVAPQTYEFMKAGSFQFGTAKYYRETENPAIRDVREGAGQFHLTDEHYEFHGAVYAGYNCGILCGTGQHAGASDPRFNQFGSVLIKIKNLKEFCFRARARLGATTFKICDVNYTNLANFHAECALADEFERIIFAHSPQGHMTDEAGRLINRRFFDTFYSFGLLPSLFCKPLSYEHELERRIVFEMPGDISTPQLRFVDHDLGALIERVT